MVYVLLWIENLAVSLLFIATVIACAARLRRRWLRLAIWVPFGFFIFLAYFVLTIKLGIFKFSYMPDFEWFYPVLALMLSYLVGVIWIRIVGLRQKTDEPAIVPAATWPRGKLMLALGIAIALHLMTIWNLDLAARQQLASLRIEAGAIAFTAMPPRVPDNDNAALFYEQAYVSLSTALRNRIMEQHEKGLNDIDVTPWVKWLDSGDSGDKLDFDLSDPDLVLFLQKQSGTISLIFEATRKPGCYFEHDYNSPSYSIILPESSTAHGVARLLALHARWKTSTRDYQTAMKDVNAMLVLAARTAEEPFMVMALVGCSLDRMAIETLQTILDSRQLHSEDFDIVKINTTISYQKLMQRAFRFEEALRLNAFCEMENIYSILKPPDNNFAVKEILGCSFIYHIFFMDKDLKANRWYTEEVNKLADRPYYQTKDEWSKLFTKGKAKKQSLLLPLILPWFERQAENMTRGDAQRRIVELVLAMCRYRAKNGKYPEKLEDLIPDFIAFIPIDPFDGKPIRLKQTDGKIVIYSIGPDGIDDGGVPFDSKSDKDDITFELPNK